MQTPQSFPKAISLAVNDEDLAALNELASSWGFDSLHSYLVQHLESMLKMERERIAKLRERIGIEAQAG